MKIKNKKELVRRAEVHREMDRYTAKAYVQKDSERKFVGCLIGCLAMPTSDKAISRKLFNIGGLGLLERVEKRFGICYDLQRTAEEFLVHLDTESNARLGGFTVSFAKALPEGRDIDNNLVERWLRSRKRLDYATTRERKAFLDWLRRGAPEPRHARL